MNIIVVRHGQTDWNLNDLVQGRTDIDLNETGYSQAYETANNLSDFSFDYIYSSPLLRAFKTANIICNNKDISITIDDRLNERNYGDFEGQNTSIKEYWNYELNLSDHNVESLEHLYNRVFDFLKYLINSYEKQDVNILIVTHDGINICIDSIIKNTTENLLNLRLKNCDYKIFKNVTIENLKTNKNKYIKEENFYE